MKIIELLELLKNSQNKQEATQEIKDNLAKIRQICEKKFNIRDMTYDASCRLILLDEEIALLLTPEVIVYIFTNPPMAEAEIKRFGNRVRLQEIIYDTFRNGGLPVINSLPNLETLPIEEQKIKCAKNTRQIIYNIAKAAGISDERQIATVFNDEYSQQANVDDLEKQYARISKTIALLKEHKLKELLTTPGSSFSAIISEDLPHGFDQLCIKLGLEDSSIIDMSLPVFCRACLNDPKLLQDQVMLNFLYDKTFIEAALTMDKRYTFQDKKYTLNAFFKEMIRQIAKNPQKYPLATEQFGARLTQIENDLQYRFNEDYINATSENKPQEIQPPSNAALVSKEPSSSASVEQKKVEEPQEKEEDIDDIIVEEQSTKMTICQMLDELSDNASQTLNDKIQENLKKIQDICAQRFYDQSYYGNASLNRQMLLDSEIASLLTPEALSYIFTNKPTPLTKIARNSSGSINLRDALYYGFKDGLRVVELMPNNESDYDPQKQKANYHSNTMAIVLNISKASGIAEIEAPKALDANTLKAQYSRILKVVKLLEKTNKLDALVYVPGYSAGEMRSQTRDGFKKVCDILGVDPTKKSLQSICQQFLSNTNNVLLDGYVIHFFYDRAHIEAGLGQNTRYKINGEKEYTFQDIFKAMIEELAKNPDKYPIAKEQFCLRFGLIENDLRDRFNEAYQKALGIKVGLVKKYRLQDSFITTDITKVTQQQDGSIRIEGINKNNKPCGIIITKQGKATNINGSSDIGIAGAQMYAQQEEIFNYFDFKPIEFTTSARTQLPITEEKLNANAKPKVEHESGLTIKVNFTQPEDQKILDERFTFALKTKNWDVVVMISRLNSDIKPKAANVTALLAQATDQKRWNDVFGLQKALTTQYHVLTSGPLIKSLATIELENLYRKLAKEANFQITVEGRDEYYTFSDGTKFNWTNIRKNANFNHVTLNKEDFDLYSGYLKEGDIRSCTITEKNEKQKREALYKANIGQSQSDSNLEITLQEMQAINIYTSDGSKYKNMNALLRGSLESQNSDIRSALIHSVMCASGLRKIPQTEIKLVYRLETFDTQERRLSEIRAAAEKGVITFNGLVSTSTTDDAYKLENAVVIYELSDVKGIYIAPLSQEKGELEFLMSSNTQIQYTNFKQTENGCLLFTGHVVAELDTANTAILATESLELEPEKFFSMTIEKLCTPQKLSSTDDVIYVINQLSEQELIGWYNTMEKDWERIIKSPADIRKIMSQIPSEKCSAFYKTMEQRQPPIIKNILDCVSLLRDQKDPQLSLIYNTVQMQTKLPLMIPNIRSFFDVYKELSSYRDKSWQADFVNNMIKYLPNLILCKHEALHQVLSLIGDTKQIAEICIGLHKLGALEKLVPTEELSGFLKEYFLNNESEKAVVQKLYITSMLDKLSKEKKYGSKDELSLALRDCLTHEGSINKLKEIIEEEKKVNSSITTKFRSILMGQKESDRQENSIIDEIYSITKA